MGLFLAVLLTIIVLVVVGGLFFVLVLKPVLKHAAHEFEARETVENEPAPEDT